MKKILLISVLVLMTLGMKSQNFQWAGMFSGGGRNMGISLVIAPTGELYTAGDFERTVDFDPGNGVINLTSFGSSDVFVEKMDLAGKLIWVKQLGGADGDYLRDIQCDAYGNIYLTGAFEGVIDVDTGDSTFFLKSRGGKDIFLAELDTGGNLVWAGSMGGKRDEYGTCISVAPSGNIYLGGYFLDTVDFNPVDTVAYNLAAVDQDIFVEKFSPGHQFVWAKVMGGQQFDYCVALCLDVKENIYTTGLFKGKDDFDPGDSTFYLTSIGPVGTYDMYISKLNSKGEFVWAKQIGGQQDETGTSIIYDGTGNLYFTGYFKGMADFDPDSGTLYLTSVDGSDAFVGKMNTGGQIIWAEQMGGTGNQYAHAVSLDNSGNICFTGLFEETADFDPGKNVFELTSVGDYDIYVAKWDTSGGFVWAAGMGGAYYERGLDVVTDSLNNVYTTGYFKGTVDFDPGKGTYYLNGLGESDVFVSKLGPGILGVASPHTLSAVAFPNPVKNRLNIKLGKTFSRVGITVIDMQGRQIFHQLYQNMNTIPLSIKAPPGIYFVKITTDKGAFKMLKVLKQ